MRAAAPACARTWRTRNARTRLRAAVHMLPCSPAPAETSASRGFAPQVCRRSEISTHCKRLSLLPPSFLRGRLVGSFARQQVSGATLHMACSHRVLTERSHTACGDAGEGQSAGKYIWRRLKKCSKISSPTFILHHPSAGGYLDILRCPSVAGPHLATLSHTPLPDHCRLARRPPPTCSGCSCLSL